MYFVYSCCHLVTSSYILLVASHKVPDNTTEFYRVILVDVEKL